MQLADLAGRAVVVWGAGREGAAAVRALADVPVVSLTVIDDLAGGPDVLTGAEAADALARADVVLKSPGVSRYDQRVLALLEAGVMVSSGTALWMATHHDRTVAVTGSKGKSTTATLIHHLAAAAGLPNTLGGNMGLPLLDLPAADRYVVELSSYQCADVRHSPRVAVFTSLFPEHLNWHGTAERYYADKLNLAGHGPRHVVYNAADPTLATAVSALPTTGSLIPVGTRDGFHLSPGPDGRGWIAVGEQPLFPRASLALRGEHNALNVCVALAAVTALGVDCVRHRDALAAALESVAPLPHRLNVVPGEGPITFVDDSLSTAPQAAVAALAAFPDGPVCLIVGGQDRGVDYAPLRAGLAGTTRPVTVIGIPDSGPRIVAAVDGLAEVRTLAATDLTEAVRLARHALPDGGTVLLSPAAPSYGIYRDFAARGDAFRAAITATA